MSKQFCTYFFFLGNIKLDTISPKQLKNRFICSEHFELNQYSNPIDPKSRLNANAVPKLYYDLKGKFWIMINLLFFFYNKLILLYFLFQ